MNKFVLFKNKIYIDVAYMNMGDIYTTKANDKLKIFIKGKIKESIYIEKFKSYINIIKILYFDIKDDKFHEELIERFSKEKERVKIGIVGVYRKIY